MRIIPTRAHGFVDYIFAIVLIAAPFVLGFATGGAAEWVPILLGVLIIGQSLMTRYELGLAPVLSMRAHLAMDIVTGLILAASPWIFGFASQVFWPHLILGLIE